MKVAQLEQHFDTSKLDVLLNDVRMMDKYSCEVLNGKSNLAPLEVNNSIKTSTHHLRLS
jgi:hypothetical protein